MLPLIVNSSTMLPLNSPILQLPFLAPLDIFVHAHRWTSSCSLDIFVLVGHLRAHARRAAYTCGERMGQMRSIFRCCMGGMGTTAGVVITTATVAAIAVHSTGALVMRAGDATAWVSPSQLPLFACWLVGQRGLGNSAVCGECLLSGLGASKPI